MQTHQLSRSTTCAQLLWEWTQRDWGWVRVAFICFVFFICRPFSAVFEFLCFKCLKGKHCTPQQWPSLTHPVSRQQWRVCSEGGKTSVWLLWNSLKHSSWWWWWQEDRWIERGVAHNPFDQDYPLTCLWPQKGLPFSFWLKCLQQP